MSTKVAIGLCAAKVRFVRFADLRHPAPCTPTEFRHTAAMNIETVQTVATLNLLGLLALSGDRRART